MEQQITSLQVDVAVIREQTHQIKLDIQEIKELTKRINELEHFRTRIRVWGSLGWAIMIAAIGTLSHKVFG